MQNPCGVKLQRMPGCGVSLIGRAAKKDKETYGHKDRECCNTNEIFLFHSITIKRRDGRGFVFRGKVYRSLYITSIGEDMIDFKRRTQAETQPV